MSPPLMFRFGELEEHATERSSTRAVLDQHSRTRVDEPRLFD
jgi:hypothetical protein